MEVKEQLVFGLVAVLNANLEDEEEEELQHVTLAQVLEAKRTYDRQTSSPFCMDLLELPTDRFKGN
jgi:hypothetical protein